MFFYFIFISAFGFESDLAWASKTDLKKTNPPSIESLRDLKVQPLKVQNPLMLKNQKYLILTPGENFLIPSDGQRVVHVSDKTIASVSLQNNHLKITGKKQGQTQLRFSKHKYQVFVTSHRQSQDIKSLHTLIENFWGLEWSLSPKNKLQITGQLYRMYDWVQIALLAKNNNIDYEFRANIAEDLKPTIMNFFESLIEPHALMKIDSNTLPQASIPHKESLNFYQKRLQGFGLQFQKDSDWFHPSPMIKIEIVMLETHFSNLISFGKKQISDQESFSLSSLLKSLNLLSAKGQSKILYHSSVFVQHGETIHLQNGGEIPFQQYNPESEHYNVNWKQYGFDFNLTAFVDLNQNIKLDINGSLSEPMSSSWNSDFVPLKKQAIKSTFSLKNKSVFSVFQQTKESHSHALKGSLLSQLPIVNSLERNQKKNQVYQTILMQVTLSEPNIQSSIEKEIKKHP